MREIKNHILVIEDELDIAELLEFHLESEGYQVSKAGNGEDGLEKARSLKPNLILLDLMLPGIHGLDVCRILKADHETVNISIIILTALGQEEDVVVGLETGADDYVTKPFSIQVLLARIRSVLRRRETESKNSLSIVDVAGIQIQPRTRDVIIGDEKLNLTFTEFQILQLLASHPGWVFTRYQIIDKIRGDNYPVTDRSVDFQIVGLRKKLGEHGACIETIRGVGYRFQSDES